MLFNHKNLIILILAASFALALPTEHADASIPKFIRYVLGTCGVMPDWMTPREKLDRLVKEGASGEVLDTLRDLYEKDPESIGIFRSRNHPATVVFVEPTAELIDSYAQLLDQGVQDLPDGISMPVNLFPEGPEGEIPTYTDLIALDSRNEVAKRRAERAEETLRTIQNKMNQADVSQSAANADGRRATFWSIVGTSLFVTGIGMSVASIPFNSDLLLYSGMGTVVFAAFVPTILGINYTLGSALGSLEAKRPRIDAEKAIEAYVRDRDEGNLREHGTLKSNIEELRDVLVYVAGQQFIQEDPAALTVVFVPKGEAAESVRSMQRKRY